MPDTKNPQKIKLNNFLGRFLGRDGKGSLSERVTNNEKKITLLKKIIQAPKAIDPKFKSLGEFPVAESLDNIHGALDDLLETIRSDKKLEDEKEEYARLKREREEREAKKKALRKQRWEGIKKVASTIIKPFRSLWDKIWGFISTILLGNIVLRIIRWMGDPKNQKTLENIGRFFKDWWPVMLASYLLFGNSFGKMAVWLVATVSKWTIKLVTVLIPKLAAAIAKLKLGNLLSLIPGGALLKSALLFGGGALATYGIGKMLGKDKVVENVTEADNTKREALKTAESTKDLSAGEIEALVQGTRTRDAGGPGTINNMKDLHNDPLGLRNDPLGGVKFNQGGFVSGPSGVDLVPARLTAGEFVMSKGAVQKWGADTLASMNAAGGGTNRPTGGRYNVGGKVDKSARIEEIKAGPVTLEATKELRQLGMNPGRINLWAKRKKLETKLQGVSPGGTGGQLVKGAGYIDSSGKFHSTPDKVLQDYREANKVVADPVANVETIKLAPGQSVDLNKVPGPPSKKQNVIVSYKQQKDAAERSAGTPPTGNKIPQFNAEKYISNEKIKTLGISL